jgi:spore coat protein CotH
VPSAKVDVTNAPNATNPPTDVSEPTTTPTGVATKDSEFFDAALVHTIAITFDQGDYDAMIKTFQDSNDKTWIAADVTIDGSTYRQAGIRLKGNSSLFGVGGFGAGGVPDVVAGTGGPLGSLPPECAAIFDEIAGGVGGPGGPGGDATAEQPESLPWLIRLDKYIPDQAHQGQTSFVVRNSSGSAPLNEAVALDLLGKADLATERASAVRFSANGGEAKVRLVIELPNDQWADATFNKGGKLYKADSTGDYSYRGTNPDDYATAWEQEGGKKDLTPLIEFLDFINNSTDEEFAAQLPNRLDVEAFARYLAFEDLINNFDDIAGPGNNSYLYFDTNSDKFTVVAWDHNLAFTTGFGPGGGGPSGGFPANLPDGCTFPGIPTDGQAPPAGAGGGNPFNRPNTLVNRFDGNTEFKAMYDEAKAALTKSLFTSGAAQKSLDAWVEIITTGAADLVNEAKLTKLADEIQGSFPGS